MEILQLDDATQEKFINELRRICDAAENSNHAGELALARLHKAVALARIEHMAARDRVPSPEASEAFNRLQRLAGLPHSVFRAKP